MRHITVSILGVCGFLALAGRGQDVAPSPPPVTDLSAYESAPYGLHWGPLRVSPSLNLSVFSDSNPTYAPSGHETGVTAIRAEPVLDMLLKGNGWDSYLRGWYIYDWYLDQHGTDRQIIDKQHYGEAFGLNIVTPHETHFGITESYEFQNRDNFVIVRDASGSFNGSWQDRQSFIVGLSFDKRLGEKTGLSLGTSYNDLWYDSPSLYSWSSESGTLGLSRKLTAKTDTVLDLNYTEQKSDGASNLSALYSALLGIASRATATSTYKAEVGYMGYDYNGGSATAGNWTYNLSGAWLLAPRLTATLSGSAAYQPAEDEANNYTKVQTLAGGLNYRATRRLTTSLSAIYRREDYARPFTATESRLDNQASAYGRASYVLRRHVSVFLGADFTKNMSSIDALDYNRLFLEAGMNVRF